MQPLGQRGCACASTGGWPEQQRLAAPSNARASIGGMLAFRPDFTGNPIDWHAESPRVSCAPSSKSGLVWRIQFGGPLELLCGYHADIQSSRSIRSSLGAARESIKSLGGARYRQPEYANTLERNYESIRCPCSNKRWNQIPLVNLQLSASQLQALLGSMQIAND